MSTVVPLDRDSTRFVHGIIDELGLMSNTAMPHVTFVEGLHAPPPPTELHALWLAMKDEPQLTIVNAICIPTRRDKGVELVCLDLQMGSGALEVATHSLASHERCRLPQWPLHLALGVAAATQARAAAKMLCQTYRGRLMFVAVEQFRILAAPTPCTAPPSPPPQQQNVRPMATADRNILYAEFPRSVTLAPVPPPNQQQQRQQQQQQVPVNNQHQQHVYFEPQQHHHQHHQQGTGHGPKAEAQRQAREADRTPGKNTLAEY